MPFPDNMVNVRWEFNWQPSGSAGPIEIQDTGIWGRFPVPGGASFPDWQSLVDDFAEQAALAWSANWTPSQFSGAVKFARAVVYHYRQDHLEVLHRGEAGLPGGATWAGSGDTLPPENSIVLTTQSYAPGVFQAKRARYTGRMYLPTPSTGLVGGDGRLSQGNAQGIVAQGKAFLDDLADTVDDVSFVPMVNSPTGQMANEIKWLRCGRVIDTQRRRRNKLAESYEYLEL